MSLIYLFKIINLIFNLNLKDMGFNKNRCVRALLANSLNFIFIYFKYLFLRG